LRQPQKCKLALPEFLGFRRPTGGKNEVLGVTARARRRSAGSHFSAVWLCLDVLWEKYNFIFPQISSLRLVNEATILLFLRF
jgi:hypothetical protein